MILVSPTRILAQDDRFELILRLLPEYYYTEITPGENITLYLEVENSGNKAITNIRFYSYNPKDWTVDFKPESIDYLGARSHQTIDVNVTADPRSKKGEYRLTLVAEADQIHTLTNTILRIENAFSNWLWVGLGVGTLVIAGFIILYRRFGRE